MVVLFIASRSIEALSVKMTIYATLIGLLSAKTPAFGIQFADRVNNVLQDALASFNHVKSRSLRARTQQANTALSSLPTQRI
jgi:hypothetical protein